MHSYKEIHISSPGFSQYTKDLVLYQGTTEVDTFEISGSVTSINESISLHANEVLSFVFDPNGTANYDFSGISQSHDYFMALDGSIQCTYLQ